MLPFMAAGREIVKIKREHWPQLAVFIGFCLFTQVPLYYAFNNAPVGAVSLIFYAMFVITAYVVGRFYLGEQITPIKLVSMIIAFIGLSFVFGVTVLSFAPLGLLLGAFNGVASGGENASSKKITNIYPASMIILWGWVFTLLTHLPISLLIGEQQVPFAMSYAWLWLLIYCFVNAAAFWMGLKGFSYVDATLGSIIGLTEVVFGVIFGALIFNEKLTAGVIIGALLILIAAALPDMKDIKRKLAV
jgi:drug/metabolite transporter (DMT)-like permease